jgi:hypothetical protein
MSKAMKTIKTVSIVTCTGNANLHYRVVGNCSGFGLWVGSWSVKVNLAATGMDKPEQGKGTGYLTDVSVPIKDINVIPKVPIGVEADISKGSNEPVNVEPSASLPIPDYGPVSGILITCVVTDEYV